jgi:hypothetical protein
MCGGGSRDRFQADVTLESGDELKITIPVLLVYETMHAVACAGSKQTALSLTGSAGLENVAHFWDMVKNERRA